MERLCGRPGCSDPASVAYGMQAEDLVFWLDRPPDLPDAVGGVLCRRHADSMIVPRGWTLDDRRDPNLHLFRPPTPLPPPTRAPRTRPPRGEQPASEQLELGAVELTPMIEPAAPAAASVEVLPLDESALPGPWTPDFDEADDLDGLLSARSPLLSRAFRTADRDVGQR